ncbi:MAG: hypothetical protein K0R28_5802 [Paenibacillus sp.]|nr:hypothetical protein [Paenibacillus sp.]
MLSELLGGVPGALCRKSAGSLPGVGAEAPVIPLIPLIPMVPLVLPDWPLMWIHSVHIPSSWIRFRLYTVCGRRMIGLDECPDYRVPFGGWPVFSGKWPIEDALFFSGARPFVDEWPGK